MFPINLYSANVDDLCLGYLNEQTNQWVCEDKDLEKDEEEEGGYVTLTGRTDHFTSFAVLLGEKPRGIDEDENDEGNGGNIQTRSSEDVGPIIAIVFVILAIIVIVVVILFVERHRRKKKKTWRGWLNKVTGRSNGSNHEADKQTEVDMSPIPTEEGNQEPTSGPSE